MALTAAATLAAATQPAGTGGHTRRECAMLQALDGSAPYVSDAEECAVRTAPASTFKIPHALIALDTGVVPGALDVVKWDRSPQPFPSWERDHSLDSAIKSSVLWFFRRTAGLIGRERMLEYLKKLDYSSDSFEGDLTSFWVNGDLVVSPAEQLRFLGRLMRHDLTVKPQHMDAVITAFLMPRGTITNAAGTHQFVVRWPEPLVVHAKTGATSVGDERVSWIIGHMASNKREYVFVSRVRARENLPGVPAADLALRVLNARTPGH